jgi:hypothetical protein
MKHRLTKYAMMWIALLVTDKRQLWNFDNCERTCSHSGK